MVCSVTRTAQSLVAPCAPTPSETLYLSDIDRVPGLRHLVRSLHVFKNGHNAPQVVKEALSKALVEYYPFAGRFVDSDHGDVRLACTGEGAWFVEAVSDCSLEDVKYLDHPLMISQDELLPDASDASAPAGINPINMPVMMQVTEFRCGGFVVGLISVHTIADGLGAGQFMNAVGDMARGLEKPTVSPIWGREFIPSPSNLPPGTPPVFQTFNLKNYTTDLGPDQINAVKGQYFESTGHRCSAFDVCIAKAWQARTRAIKLGPDELVNVCFFANTRHLLHQVLPKESGFYGNCFYPVTVTNTSSTIIGSQLVDVVKIIRDAKADLPMEFAKWSAGDLKEDPYQLTFTYNSLFVSDWTRLGFLEVDYGWGLPVHVIPFAYFQFMAVAIIGAPPSPKKGARIMTQCVEKEHMRAFQDEMKAF